MAIILRLAPASFLLAPKTLSYQKAPTMNLTIETYEHDNVIYLPPLGVTSGSSAWDTRRGPQSESLSADRCDLCSSDAVYSQRMLQLDAEYSIGTRPSCIRWMPIQRLSLDTVEPSRIINFTPTNPALRGLSLQEVMSDLAPIHGANHKIPEEFLWLFGIERSIDFMIVRFSFPGYQTLTMVGPKLYSFASITRAQILKMIAQLMCDYINLVVKRGLCKITPDSGNGCSAVANIDFSQVIIPRVTYDSNQTAWVPELFAPMHFRP